MMPKRTPRPQSGNAADRKGPRQECPCTLGVAQTCLASTIGMLTIATLGCSGGHQAAEERLVAEEIMARDQEIVRYEAEAARMRAEVLSRFDRNRDGVLTGREDEVYRSYLTKVRSGEVANPFEDIASPGAAPR